MRKSWTTEEDEQLRACAASMDYFWIKEALKQFEGRTHASVQLRAKRLGLLKTSSVNADYFKTWSHNMAYALGYIWTDGSVEKKAGRLRLRCSPCDDYVIHAIAKEIGGSRLCKPVPPSDIPFDGNNKGVIKSKGLTSVAISSRRLIDSLCGLHGIIQNKSGLNPEYREVPDEFFGDFLRGVIDGDGCLMHSNKKSASFVIYGSDRFLIGIANQAARVLSVSCPPLGRCRKLGRIQWTAQEDSARIFSAMYEHAETGFFLRRKQEKWLQYASASQLKSTGRHVAV